MKDFKIEKLPNGATIILKPEKNIKFTVVNMGFKAGAYMDEVKGTAHFLEHILFLGTETRTREAIERDESEICRLNAATSRYSTVVYLKRANSELDSAMQFASDILLNTKFDETEIEKEREVVRNEILSCKERDKRNVYAYHQQLWNIFVRDNISDICGQDIDKVTIKELQAYRNKHYVAQNFVMVVASSLPMSKILAYYKKYIEPHLKSDIVTKTLSYDMEFKKESKIQVIPLDQEKIDVAISIGIPFGSLSGKIYVMRRILINYLNREQPFTKLRNKGLIYGISSSLSTYKENSLFTIKFTSTKDNVNKVIQDYSEELQNLYKNGMDETKFKNICKQLVIAEDEKEKEDFGFIVGDVLYDYCFNSLTDEVNVRKELKKISLDDLNNFIKLLGNPKNKMYVTVLGDIKEEEVYNLKQIQQKLFISKNEKEFEEN